jgi:hypothetical protein
MPIWGLSQYAGPGATHRQAPDGTGCGTPHDTTCPKGWDYGFRGAKSGRMGVGLILIAGLMLAACSSPSQDSLASDQRAVEVAQAAVARDEAALPCSTLSSNVESACVAESTSQAISCATAGTDCPPSVSSLQAKLKAAEFKLQMAQNRLKKDYPSDVSGTRTSMVNTPTTHSVNCGGLPVGPGAGPPPASCSGLP